MDIRTSSDGVVFKNGKLQVTSSKGESLAQRLTIRLKTNKNEWFLDTTIGIDYFDRVFEKGNTKSSIDKDFETEILREYGVARISYFKSIIRNRVYQLSFKVQMTDDSLSDLVTIQVSREKVEFLINGVNYGDI